MQQFKMVSDLKNEAGLTSIPLTAYLFQENDIHYAYLPALDITGYGYNGKEAWNSLQIMLTEFMNYTIENGTFLPELKRLGWNTTIKGQTLTPPSDSEMHQTNEQLQEIICQSAYSTYTLTAQLPTLL